MTKLVFYIQNHVQKNPQMYHCRHLCMQKLNCVNFVTEWLVHLK